MNKVQAQTERKERYGAIVIYPNEKIVSYDNLIAIGRAEAQVILKHKRKKNILIKDILYSPVLNVWVALFPLHNSGLPIFNKMVTQNSCYKERRDDNEK
jgi:hypothetical protein